MRQPTAGLRGPSDRRAELEPFTREFTKRGLPYVELDVGGQVVRRQPTPAGTYD